MDLMQRLALTYLGFVVALPSIALWMQANGVAYPENPSWVLISALRNVALGSMAIITLGGLIFVAFAVAAIRKEEKEQRKIEADRKRQEAAVEARWARKQVEERHQEDARRAQRIEEENQKRIREEEKNRERQAAKEREQNEKRKRTSEDAVSSALDEFL